MKKVLFTTLALLSAFAARAQTDTVKNFKPTMIPVKATGAEYKMMFPAGKDTRTYDEKGDLIDSLTAVNLAKTFEYQFGLSSVRHDGTYQRTLFKIDPVKQAQMDAIIKKMVAPKNAALLAGQLLDIKPFGDRIRKSEVSGKALVLIFWCPGCYAGSQADAFKELNEVVANYVDRQKFEVYAITRSPYDVAIRELKKSPIKNAHHLFDSGYLMDVYAPDNRPLLIVTDKEQQITYSAINNVQITPRVLNSLLKAL